MKNFKFTPNKEYFKDNGEILQVNIDAFLKNITGSAQKEKKQLFDYINANCDAFLTEKRLRY